MTGRTKAELVNQMRNNEARKMPLYSKLEAVIAKMKKVWNENGWIVLDSSAMAVLEDLRKEHEAKAKEIDDIVGKQKIEAHNEVEMRFDAIHDKKLLQLQLKSMQSEYEAITRIVESKHGKRK